MPSPHARPARDAELVPCVPCVPCALWRRRPARSRGVTKSSVLGVAVLIASGLGVAVLGARVAASFRKGPTSVRCPLGTAPQGPRCCPEGQTFQSGACRGAATACQPGATLLSGDCEVIDVPLPVEGGIAGRVPADWQGQAALSSEQEGSRQEGPRQEGSDGSREGGSVVPPFLLDRTEVNERHWDVCVSAKRCAPRVYTEPALPVRSVSPDLARAYCRFRGGDLPTGSEWLLAAAGVTGRRFPWGPAGLVCRRAAFGLLSGPCGISAVGPDLVGSRPDGASPDGIVDLSGNVAEWTREPSGGFVARGGSYASKNPAELQTSAFEESVSPAPHIGFRCAYRLPRASSPSVATE